MIMIMVMHFILSDREQTHKKTLPGFNRLPTVWCGPKLWDPALRRLFQAHHARVQHPFGGTAQSGCHFLGGHMSENVWGRPNEHIWLYENPMVYRGLSSLSPLQWEKKGYIPPFPVVWRPETSRNHQHFQPSSTQWERLEWLGFNQALHLGTTQPATSGYWFSFSSS